MALDLTSFDPLLKKYYTPKMVANMVFADRPLLGMLPKRTITGKSYEVPIRIGSTGGRSADFAQALASKNSSTQRRFSGSVVKNYSLADIDALTIDSSKGDRGAFMEALTSEIDMTFTSWSNDAAVDVYGNGTGLRGTITALTASSITVSTQDARKFFIGMRLEFVDSASGVTGALIGAPLRVRVTSVDRSTGVVGIDADITASVTVNDFVFAAGDAANGGALKKMVGLDGWAPTGTITSATHFGVDRTADPVFLAAVQYDGSGDASILDTYIKAGAQLSINGGRADYIFANPLRIADMAVAMDGKAKFEKVKSSDSNLSGHLGYDAIVVHTAAGVLRLIGDPWCPYEKSYMMKMDTWELVSVGSFPRLLNTDGNRILRLATEDAYEVRVGGYTQLFCNAPGHNCVISH